jgi:hypothetical protein
MSYQHPIDSVIYFQHYFRMPLWKVEELCDLLIIRGYIPLPRTRFRQEEFRDRTELLVMSPSTCCGRARHFGRVSRCATSPHQRSASFFYCFLTPLSTCVTIRSTCRGTNPNQQR